MTVFTLHNVCLFTIVIQRYEIMILATITNNMQCNNLQFKMKPGTGRGGSLIEGRGLLATCLYRRLDFT